ncbi:integrase core domain-containing protein [Acinetobacter soli]
MNQYCFRITDEVKYEIDLWRKHYTNIRPHSSLNCMSPAEYAKQNA